MLAFGALSVTTFLKYYDDRPYTVFSDDYEINGANPYIPYSNIERGYKAQAELTETIYYVCGFFACLLGGLPLYWFGCLFQRVEYIQSDMIELRNQIQGGKPDA